MNATLPTAAQSRLVLSALADRLVFGDAHTFDPADASELADLIPAQTSWHQWLSGWMPQLRANLDMPGRSAAGFAAGVGNVSVGGDRIAFDLDSRGRRVVRAGLWKLSWAGRGRGGS